jgi:hypothetical protein
MSFVTVASRQRSLDLTGRAWVGARSHRQPPRGSQKTRIRNGSAIIAGVHLRSLYIRRLKELLADYESDIPEASTAAAAQ